MVCESHPKLAWWDDVLGCQCGAGTPCECQGAQDGIEEPVRRDLLRRNQTLGIERRSFLFY